MRHDGRAAHEAYEDPRLVAERVEERVDDQVAVALAEANDVRPHLEDAERLRVRRHDTLGLPGRAAREDDVGEVVGLAGSLIEDRFLYFLTVLSERGPVRLVAPGLSSQEDHFDPVRIDFRVLEQLRVVDVQEPSHGEEQLRAALLQHEPRLSPLEPRVDRNKHSAGGQRSQRSDDPFMDVRRPDRDTIAGLDAYRDRGARGMPNGNAKVLERDPRFAVDHGFTRAEAFGGTVEQPWDRPPLEVAAH